MIEVVTEHPVAVDSLDHRFPLGTMFDNTPDSGFIADVEQYFGRKPLKFLDIGCAGGQFVVDAITRGHKAVGLEGSDKPGLNGVANWPEYGGTALFTCDVRYPFEIREDGELIQFDCITAWDVLEHISKDDLPRVLDNIRAHLAPNGIFCGKVYIGSAGTVEYITADGSTIDIDHHITCESENWWENTLTELFRPIVPCPISHWLREGHFMYCLEAATEMPDDYTLHMDSIVSREMPQAWALGELLYWLLSPTSVVDIGCGPGIYLLPYISRGIRTLGVDWCEYASQVIPCFERADLRLLYSSNDMFDLALCIEVGEHLREEYADTLVKSVADTSNTIFWSAAIEGQRGTFHYNCQSVEYWLAKFEKHNFSKHLMSNAIINHICTDPIYLNERFLMNSILLTRNA